MSMKLDISQHKVRYLQLLTMLAALASLLYSPVPARAGTGPSAQYCAHGLNSGDTACVNSKNNEKYIATETKWTDNNIDVLPNSGDKHINNDMWVYTSQDETYSVEVGAGYGTCKGYSGTTIINVCPGAPSGYKAYRFWADTFPRNGQTNQYLHWNSWWTRNDGSLHLYDILRETSTSGNICYWDLWIDNIYAGVTQYQYCPGGYSYAYEDQVGMEFNGPGNASWPYSNANIFQGLKTWHDGAWHSWEYQRQWIDYACGVGSNGTTDCFNGTNYNDNTSWYVNRPRG